MIPLYLAEFSHRNQKHISLSTSGFSLSTSGRCIKDINQILYTFIRKNKHYYIRKSDVVKPISKGGLNVIYLDVVTLKLRRLQAFLRNKHSDGSYNYFYDFC